LEDFDRFTAAVCEMTSGEDVDANLKQVMGLLEEAAKRGADFISFPENSLFMRVDENRGKFALPQDHPALAEIAEVCRKMQVCVHLGSVPCQVDGRVKNSTFLIAEDGSVRRVYDKIHLFDIELAGKKPVRESDYFTHGETPNVVEWRGFRLGLAICYDVRFAELFCLYAQQAVDVLLIPAAFLVETGRAHWEVLLRARAIENQCYVLAAAQEGEHFSDSGLKRATYGHSLIVDPWGQVAGVADAKNRIVLAEVSRQKILEVRRQLPMADHRRLLAGALRKT
jgi:predicted amidohydrolase